MGAIPIISQIVLASLFGAQYIRGFYVRKEPKGYGLESQIEGHFVYNTPIAICEDVTASGGSVIKAAKIIRKAGGQVNHAITIVDRDEGAIEKCKNEGIHLVPLLLKIHILEPDLLKGFNGKAE